MVCLRRRPGYPYAGRVEQVIESVGAADRGRVESYTVKWDDVANPSRVAARDVTPIGKKQTAASEH